MRRFTRILLIALVGVAPLLGSSLNAAEPAVEHSRSTAEELAESFVAAWNAGKPLPALSRIAPELNLRQAYKIQRTWVQQTLDDDGIGGIKGGVVTPAGQKWLGITEPVGAILRASGRFEGRDSPVISRQRFPGLKLECEIGFTIGSPLLKRPESVDELQQHISGIIPVIELISGDWEGPAGERPTAAELAAINVIAAGYIVGHPVAKDQINPKAIPLNLSRNGDVINTAKGSDCWEGPWETALWLAQFAHDQGVPLTKGQVIICGALGKILEAEPGDYHYNAGDLGAFSFSVK
tara:strand:- start:3014 stop:3895 length:882 start_codon:yes stop_codon:yes gene_type:complete